MNQLLAVEIGQMPLGTGPVSSKYQSVSTLVSLVIKNSLTIASIVFVGLLIFGGLSLIISAGSGDPKKTAQAQGAISNALIGFVIVILAYAIIQIIEIITGLPILKSNL